jgi:hypothetical protein
LDRWAEHFNELLNRPIVAADQDLLYAANHPKDAPPCFTEPATIAEIRNAARKLKNGRAPGLCNTTAEFIKAGGDALMEWLTHIVNVVWVQEHLPDDWRRGIILPFWKGKGDPQVCSNHRA